MIFERFKIKLKIITEMKKQKTNQSDLYKGFRNGFLVATEFFNARSCIQYMDTARFVLDLEHHPHEDNMTSANTQIEKGATITKKLYEMQSKIGGEYPKQFLKDIDMDNRLSNLIKDFVGAHKGLCYEYAFKRPWGEQ